MWRGQKFVEAADHGENSRGVGRGFEDPLEMEVPAFFFVRFFLGGGVEGGVDLQ